MEKELSMFPEEATNAVVVALPTEVEELALKVSEQKQAEVKTVLNQIFAGTSDWKKQAEAIEIKGIADVMSIKLADVGRKNVKTARLHAEKIFDAKREEVQRVKSEYDLEDKLWLKAKQTAVILFKDIEDTFEWKANYVKRYEAEQKELQTQLRIEKVSKFNPEINRYEFENMSDEMFGMFLSGIEKDYNDKIEAEKQAELARIEAERIDVLGRERISETYKYAQFMNDLVSVVSMGSMSDKDYDSFLSSLKAKKDAYDKEQERIRLENERLKAEAEALRVRNEKRNNELRPYIIFIRDYNKMLSLSEPEYQKEFSEIKKGAEDHWEFEHKEQIRKQKEQEEAEAKQRKKDEEAAVERKRQSDLLEAQRKENERIQREKDAENARLAKELKDKQQAEAATKAEAERKEKERIAAEAKAAKAPDKDKLLKWVNEVSMPELRLSTPDGIGVAQLIDEKFEAFKRWAITQIETL